MVDFDIKRVLLNVWEKKIYLLLTIVVSIVIGIIYSYFFKQAIITSNIDYVKEVGVFFIVGITMFLVCIFIATVLETKIKLEKDIKEIDLNVLGIIPKKEKKRISKYSPEKESLEKQIITEFFRKIKNNIEFNKNVKNPKSIFITSANKKEGKTYVSSNLAVLYAKTNQKVLIIDTDIQGTQDKIFKVDNNKGLLDILSGNENYLQKEYINSTNIENIDIITKGSYKTNFKDLLIGEKFKGLIEVAKAMYDIVIIDGISGLTAEDLAVISTYVDSTIIVTKYGVTKLEELQSISKNILDIGGKVSGAIINQFSKHSPEYKK